MIDICHIEELLKDPSRGEDGSAADVRLLEAVPDLVQRIRWLEAQQRMPPSDEEILDSMTWLVGDLKSRWDGIVAICKRLGITVDALQALADQWGDGSEPACYRNDEVELTIRRVRKEDP